MIVKISNVPVAKGAKMSKNAVISAGKTEGTFLKKKCKKPNSTLAQITQTNNTWPPLGINNNEATESIVGNIKYKGWHGLNCLNSDKGGVKRRRASAVNPATPLMIVQ